MTLFEYAALPGYIVPETLVVESFGAFLVASSLILVLRHRRDVVRRFCLLLLPVGTGLWGLGFRIDETTILGNPHVGPLEETLELLGMAVALAGVSGYATTNLPRSRIQGSRFLVSLCLTNVILVILLLVAPIWEDRVFPEARFLWRTFGHRINADIGRGSIACAVGMPIPLDRESPVGYTLFCKRSNHLISTSVSPPNSLTRPAGATL